MDKTAKEWKREAFEFGDIGDFKNAVKCIDNALELEPDNPDIWITKGLIIAMSGEVHMEYFDKAIKLDPTIQEAWRFKGNAYMTLIEKEIDEEDEEYILNLCKEGLKCFDKAIELKPTDSDSWTGKGVISFYSKDNKNVIKYLDRSLELDSQNIVALNGKSLFYADQGDYENALNYVNKSLSIDPEDESALKIKEQIIKDKRATATKIQFPTPFDWFQKEIWRIKMLEWDIIFVLAFVSSIIKGEAILLSSVIQIPILGLVFTFLYTPISKAIFKLFRILRLGALSDLMEGLYKLVDGINHRLIIDHVYLGKERVKEV